MSLLHNSDTSPLLLKLPPSGCPGNPSLGASVAPVTMLRDSGGWSTLVSMAGRQLSAFPCRSGGWGCCPHIRRPAEQTRGQCQCGATTALCRGPCPPWSPLAVAAPLLSPSGRGSQEHWGEAHAQSRSCPGTGSGPGTGKSPQEGGKQGWGTGRGSLLGLGILDIQVDMEGQSGSPVRTLCPFPS